MLEQNHKSQWLMDVWVDLQSLNWQMSNLQMLKAYSGDQNTNANKSQAGNE